MDEMTTGAAEQSAATRAHETSVVRPGRPRVTWTPALGAIAAGFAASLCCIGPLVFVTFGVGAGLASTFQPFRPLFTALMALALALGFYTVYGRPWLRARTGAAGAATAGGACAVPRSRRREQVILWTATALALVFWSFEYWSGVLS